MKILNDIWDSIRGSAKTRITDPIIGAFIISLVLCNWDRLAVLFWGNGTLESRVKNISSEMGFISRPELIYQNYDLLVLPVILSVLYIFALPVLSGRVTGIINPIELQRHRQTIDLHIDKEKKQRSLNKARLRADPNNDFLAKEVEIDLAKEKSTAEKLEHENKTAKDNAEKEKAEKERAVLDRNTAESLEKAVILTADSAVFDF